MRLSVALGLAAVLFCPLGARAGVAAKSAAPVEDRPVPKLNEVERGFFLGAEGGGLFLFSPSASQNSGLSPGRIMGLSIGGDLGSYVALSLFVLGTHSDTPAGFISPDDTANTNRAPMSGDFSTLIVGAMAKAYVLQVSDDNGVKRLLGYLRGGAGSAFISPKNFYASNDVVILGGAGVEYFTHLRHFSLGIDVDFVMGLSHLGAGVMIAPNLRYTF
jgi:hypothetical protein